MNPVESNYQWIKEKISRACKAAGRDPASVNLVAVTKYVSLERAKHAYEAGVRHFGENRPDGLAAKQPEMPDCTWHFIGTLQSRKVKQVLPAIDYLHSLDRLSIVKEIEKRSDKPLKCFIQVNVSGEESKHGLAPRDVIPFIESIKGYEKTEICGLMTMAPHTEDKGLIRDVFKKLKNLQLHIAERKYPHAPCRELSMGMSGDFEIAVEEGATFVRIGTSLVGNEVKEDS